MNNLNPGAKVRMLNNCRFGMFKKDTILTIKISHGDNTYDCEEKYGAGSPIYISLSDKFRIVDLTIFEQLGTDETPVEEN